MLKKFRLLLFFLLIGLGALSPQFGYTEIIHTWEGVMYVTDSTIRFAWDAVEGAAYYEVKAIWVDPKDEPVEYDLGQVTNTEIVIEKPKVGHFYFKVRACNDEGGCSPWSETIDPEKTQIQKPFYIYFKLSPAGNITIH